MVAAVMAGLVATALAGCSSGFGARESARKGGSLVVALAAAPDSLDPSVARSATARQALWTAYTAPMTYSHQDGASGVAPALAAGAPKASADNTQFTFRFRSGLRYSDGRSLRASDLTRALRRARRLNPVARSALDGVTVVTDDARRQVTITVPSADPDFPRVLAEPWAAPLPPGVPMDREARGRLPGIGPYVLAPAPPGHVYSLVRRHRFSIPNVPTGNADSITARVVADRDARTRQALDGRVDLSAGSPPSPDLPRVRSEDKERYREFPTLTTRALTFALDRPPFEDANARQAVAFSLDIRTLSRLEEGFLSPACNVLPPAVAGYQKVDPCPFGMRLGDPDLVRAAQLAGRAKGRRTVILVDPGAGAQAAGLGGYVIDTVNKIGLRARLARTPGQRRRAQLRVASLGSADALPSAYFARVGDSGVVSDVGVLTRDGTAAANASRWARIDARVVSDALAAPYGVQTTGVLFSSRVDAANCVRFSPIYGTDLSSLCLK